MTRPAGGLAHLRAPALLAYGAGEMAVTISMVAFGLFVLFFYTSVMQLPAALAGLGSSAGLLWDAVIDPYIGHRSDRHGGRLGRRHGYMLLGALLMGPAFWLLFSPAQGLGTAALFLWLLGTTLLCRFAGALFRIPYLGLGAELSRDYHERTTIVGVRSAFGLVGTLAAATLSFVVFFPNEVKDADPKLAYAGYPQMGLWFGLAMTASGLIATLGTLGHRHADPGTAGEGGSFVRGFASAWANPAFRRVWLTFTLFGLGVVLNAVVAIHYFTWCVRITDSQTLSRIQSCFYVGALAGVLPWVRLARRAEKRTLCLVSVIVTGVLLSLATFLMGEGRLFGTGNALPLLAGNLLAGGFAAAVWVLPGSMLADVADDDELRTGERREGLLFGWLSFGEKIAAGAALLAAGVLLDLFVGLTPGTTPSADATFRIGLVYGVVPAAILAGGALALGGYALSRRAVADIQRQLKPRPAWRGAVPAAAELARVEGAPAAP